MSPTGVDNDVLSTAVLTVLVVDDAPDMRLLARAVLEHAGISVVGEAADGHEALAIFRALDPPPIPTVILLDNQMPGMGGLEVAAQMVAEVPNQIIVLFSAYLDDGIVEQARRLGIAACVPKNGAQKLAGLIRDLAGQR